MVVCQYFLRGQCKFGDNCRNEHPRGGFSTWELPFTANSITKDLTPQVDKPMWPLSSYGAAKFEPTLIGGLDESQEELRVRAAMAIQAGKAKGYIEYEAGKISAAEAVFNNARANIHQAYETAAKQSPTSLSFASIKTSSFNKPPGSESTFGQSAFGRTGFGATPSAFGQPSTSMAATGAFGQPVQQPTSAFGAPSQTSQSTSGIIKPATGAFSSFAAGSGAFGANATASASGGFSAFSGQPPPFGLNASAPSTTTGTFGQPSFGTPSAFGALSQQPQQPPSPFGTFGQPATQPQPGTSVFGSSAFGAPAQRAQPFGSASTQPAPNSSVFSALSPSTSSFAQPAQQANPELSVFATNKTASNASMTPVTSSFASAGTELGKKPHDSPPNFDAIIELGLQCVSGAATGIGQSTALFEPNSTPYNRNLPTNYAEIIPQDMMQAFKSNKFEWGKVPESVPPLQLR